VHRAEKPFDIAGGDRIVEPLNRFLASFSPASVRVALLSRS
jgi:hypothetical protein